MPEEAFHNPIGLSLFEEIALLELRITAALLHLLGRGRRFEAWLRKQIAVFESQ